MHDTTHSRSDPMVIGRHALNGIPIRLTIRFRFGPSRYSVRARCVDTHTDPKPTEMCAGAIGVENDFATPGGRAVPAGRAEAGSIPTTTALPRAAP
jgi:hypothetical protein